MSFLASESDGFGDLGVIYVTTFMNSFVCLVLEYPGLEKQNLGTTKYN